MQRRFVALKPGLRLQHTLVGIFLLALALAWIVSPFTQGPSPLRIFCSASAGIALCAYAIHWAKRRALARLRAIWAEIHSARSGRIAPPPSPARLRRYRRLATAAVVLGLCGLLTLVWDHPESAAVRRTDLMLGAAQCGLALAVGALALWGLRRALPRARIPAGASWPAIVAIAVAAMGLVGLPLQ